MKKLFTIRNVHIASTITIIGVFIVAATAYIHNDVAFIRLFGMEDFIIGGCFYRDHFGITCPSCGLTRSFIAIENFQFQNALSYNRVGIFIYFLFLLTFVFNIVSIFKMKRANFIGKIVAVYGVFICIVLVISWVLKYFFSI
ncbi:MAG: DUF2752 domain-containing protein [Vallitaleaceae bacterium]|nr:DUF2752 domain-containing protein [Vallitaleaceae bacterium]